MSSYLIISDSNKYGDSSPDVNSLTCKFFFFFKFMINDFDKNYSVAFFMISFMRLGLTEAYLLIYV